MPQLESVPSELSGFVEGIIKAQLLSEVLGWEQLDISEENYGMNGKEITVLGNSNELVFALWYSGSYTMNTFSMLIPISGREVMDWQLILGANIMGNFTSEAKTVRDYVDEIVRKIPGDMTIDQVSENIIPSVVRRIPSGYKDAVGREIIEQIGMHRDP